MFALSVPFWLLGAVTDLQLLPGLPMSAFALFCPVTAAAILVHRQNGTQGVIRLLKRALDYQRISAKAWYAPILLLMPAVMVLSYGLMRVMGMPLPTPQFSVLGAVVLFLAFFLGGAAEELGWSGYVIDPMQRRWTALQASILLGSVWATWHIVALVQADRSLTWIAGWCLSTARYFPEASSISFRRAVVYGLNVLAISIQYQLNKWGWLSSPVFLAVKPINRPGSFREPPF